MDIVWSDHRRFTLRSTTHHPAPILPWHGHVALTGGAGCWWLDVYPDDGSPHLDPGLASVILNHTAAARGFASLRAWVAVARAMAADPSLDEADALPAEQPDGSWLVHRRSSGAVAVQVLPAAVYLLRPDRRHRRQRHGGPDPFCSFRAPPDLLAALDAARRPREGRSAAIRRILRDALGPA